MTKIDSDLGTHPRRRNKKLSIPDDIETEIMAEDISSMKVDLTINKTKQKTKQKAKQTSLQICEYF